MSNKNICQLDHLLATTDHPNKHMAHGFAA